VGSPSVFLSERESGNLSILDRLKIGKIIAQDIKNIFCP
jgi:hypothetical protein